MLASLRQHQVLYRKLDVDHATRAVLDVKVAGPHGVGRAHPLAHGHNFLLQVSRLPRRADDSLAHRIKALPQVVATQNTAGPCHGLVFPGPGGVAATLLLVVGVSIKGGNQQAGIAVGSQSRVDLVQVAFAGLDRQPGDQLAYQGGIDLAGPFVVVCVDEHDVEVTAIAQFLAA